MQKRVDKSLKLLKQLQEKLKGNHPSNFQTPKKTKIAPIYELQTADPDSNFKQLYIKLQSPKQSVLTNQNIGSPKASNDYCNRCQQISRKLISVQDQNIRMKNYINCLIKMNDFLKSQVLQQNQNLLRVKRQKQQHFQRQNPEVTIMKMEIEYLKKLNDDREKQIYQYHTDINQRYLHRQISDQMLATPVTNYAHSRNPSTIKKSHKKHYTSLNMYQHYNEPIIKASNRQLMNNKNTSSIKKKTKLKQLSPQFETFSTNPQFIYRNQSRLCCKNNFY